MSFDILLQLNLFESADDLNFTRRCLLHILECQTNVDREWLRAHPETPKLYRAGLIYMPDERPIGPMGERVECWISILEILRRGGSDCKNLVAWRCAELREQGIRCWPYIRWRDINPDFTLYHVLVQFPLGARGLPDTAFLATEDDGSTIVLEDPSKILGMP